MLLGLFILSPDGFTGSMLQLFFHAAAKIAIFQCAGSIILLAHKTRVDELRGLGRRMPVTFIPPVISAFFPGHDTTGLDLSPIREPLGITVPLVIFAAICGLMGLFPNGVLSVMESIAGAVA